MDKHWNEVMKLAEQYGLIVESYGGTAVLATHEIQQKCFGKEKYKRMQKTMEETFKNRD